MSLVQRRRPVLQPRKGGTVRLRGMQPQRLGGPIFVAPTRAWQGIPYTNAGKPVVQVAAGTKMPRF